MTDPVTPSSTIVAAKGQISTDLGGESVILGLSSGKYYSLNDSGSLIWNLIRDPTTVQHLVDALVDEYEIDRKPCESDLIALLGQLDREGLITVGNND